MRNQLESELETFREDVYLPLIGDDLPDWIDEENLRRWHHSCKTRFDSAVTRATDVCTGVPSDLSDRCKV